MINQIAVAKNVIFIINQGMEIIELLLTCSKSDLHNPLETMTEGNDRRQQSLHSVHAIGSWTIQNSISCTCVCLIVS